MRPGRARARAPGCPAGEPVQVRGAGRPVRAEVGVPADTPFRCNHRLLGFLRLSRRYRFWLEIARPDVYMIILVGNSWHCATHVIVYTCRGSYYLFWEIIND